MRHRAIALATVLAVAAIIAPTASAAPTAHVAVACSSFSSQLSADMAANTRDPDHDGIYCEDNPCPCSADWYAQHGGSPNPPPAPTPDPEPDIAPTPTRTPAKPPHTTKPRTHGPGGCKITPYVVLVPLDHHKYAHILAHMRHAIRKGWPRILRIHRPGADQRRNRRLRHIRTRPGMDRDEWPMAFARTTWRADVAYVPARENRSAGARIGGLLRRYCNGTRFRVIAD